MDPIRRARMAGKLIRKRTKAKDRKRYPITVYLDRGRFETFRKACAKEKRSASEIIDELIAAYLEI